MINNVKIKSMIFAILAAIFYAINIPLSKILLNDIGSTMMISSKDTFEIVILKGIFSGIGSFVIALLVKEKIPSIYNAIKVLLLGFVAYGLSIFMYVRAQKELGASKTSAFYSINPFIGAFLGFLFLKEELDLNYYIALIIMILGTMQL